MPFDGSSFPDRPERPEPPRHPTVIYVVPPRTTRPLFPLSPIAVAFLSIGFALLFARIVLPALVRLPW